ncbi:Dabb family protein [Nocardia rhamnosiphila]|uniref:Dabb family protein n=1 Tax=Nocardia rhamnosiphila TaxID=426716 RepID=UPI0034038558
MYKVTHLLHLGDSADELAAEMTVKRLTAAADAARVRHSLVSRTLPGVRNGGDILAHFQFSSKSDWLRNRSPVDEALTGSAIEHIDSVEYSGESSRAGRRPSPHPATVYRTLLLRVDDAATAEQTRRFEHATLQMPVHIRAMRAWQLSRVEHATGSVQWTHVWEQEYGNVGELLGPYMYHPIHWGHVDQWFDPECPEQIVKERICHSFCEIPAPVIEPAPGYGSAAEEG